MPILTEGSMVLILLGYFLCLDVGKDLPALKHCFLTRNKLIKALPDLRLHSIRQERGISGWTVNVPPCQHGAPRA